MYGRGHGRRKVFKTPRAAIEKKRIVNGVTECQEKKLRETALKGD